MISGTDASAIETGQFVLRRAPPRAGTPASSIPGTVPTTASCDLRDPGSGDEGHRRVDVELLRRRACLREAVRERHREARRVRGRDELLRARAPVRLLGARRPRDVERPEGAAPDARDRSGAFHERAGPGDVRGAIGHQESPPSRIGFDGDGSARPDERGERAARVSGLRRRGEGRVVGTRHDGSGGDVRRDDPVPRALDLVHRDRAADVHALRWIAQPSSSLPSEVTKQVACAAASSSSGLVFPSMHLDPRCDGRPRARTSRCSRPVRRPTRAQSSPPSRSPPRGRSEASTRPSPRRGTRASAARASPPPPSP